MSLKTVVSPSLGMLYLRHFSNQFCICCLNMFGNLEYDMLFPSFFHKKEIILVYFVDDQSR